MSDGEIHLCYTKYHEVFSNSLSGSLKSRDFLCVAGDLSHTPRHGGAKATHDVEPNIR